ncbi:MAG: lactonase family protein [Clostridiales bacterium]|nr:lactonase family protein [Clostridiales bacterium]
MEKHYAFVGSWSIKDEPHGLSIFSFQLETAEMVYLKTISEAACVGCQYLDRDTKRLYITNEGSFHRAGARGGQVLGFQIGTGENILVPFTQQETLLPKPSFLTMTKEKDFLLASIHGNRGAVTKLVKRKDGTLSSVSVPDDAGLALFPVDSDGTIGELADLYVTTRDRLSHQHCVQSDPSGKLFLACDKGLDVIHSFALDRDSKKLILLRTTPVTPGSLPRYAAFHPVKPFFLENNEHDLHIYSYRYDTSSGEIELIEKHLILEGAASDASGIMPSDLFIHPNGETAYVSVRGADLVIVLSVCENGSFRCVQSINCGGKNPRGLCLSPDGRFLLSANIGSETITAMRILENGQLCSAKEVARAHLPGNLTIY